MSSTPPASPRALQISTPTDTTIVLTRSFNAPPPLVWEAMFTPERMRRWMCNPFGWALTICVCDPRVGGVLELSWRSPEADPAMTLKGLFTDVILHEHAVHTETMALGSGQTVGSLLERHAFTEANGVTAMTITQTYASKEERDEAVASGMDQGMEAGYLQLDAMLA